MSRIIKIKSSDEIFALVEYEEKKLFEKKTFKSRTWFNFDLFLSVYFM